VDCGGNPNHNQSMGLQNAINFNDSYATQQHNGIHSGTQNLQSSRKDDFQMKLDSILLLPPASSNGMNSRLQSEIKPCFSVGITSTKNATAKGKGGLMTGSLNRYQVNSINNSFSKLNTVKLKPVSS
jgi:hypothetical protein